MTKQELLRLLQLEIRNNSFDTFVDEPPSIAQGGRGVVVPGCPNCKKRFETSSHFIDHITKDVLPSLLDKLSSSKNQSGEDS